MSVAMPATALNYAEIAKALSEIRKRAIRLQRNLGFDRLDLTGETATAASKPAYSASDIKAHLRSLDRFIMSFIENPIFKSLRSLM